MARRVRLVVVCEDILHATLARAFLYRRGFARRDLTFRPAPAGAGDAKRHVCDEACRELTVLRKFPGEDRGLVIILDADNLSPEERLRWIWDACRTAALEPPRDDEAVFIVIPKWEVENWLAYLRGEAVDEQSNRYDKYRGRESQIYPLVEKLADMCSEGHLPDAPPSLLAACDVHRRFKEWSRG